MLGTTPTMLGTTPTMLDTPPQHAWYHCRPRCLHPLRSGVPNRTGASGRGLGRWFIREGSLCHPARARLSAACTPTPGPVVPGGNACPARVGLLRGLNLGWGEEGLGVCGLMALFCC